MHYLIFFEWFTPPWNFVTHARASGRWAARHMQPERVSLRWTPSRFADAVAIRVPASDAGLLYTACRMSPEEMDEHRKVRAWRAVEIDPHWITELDMLARRIAQGMADPEHLRRAIAERDRLAIVIERKAA